MKIIIVGDGKVGFTLATQLSKEGHDITVIDKNREVLQSSVDRLDVMVIHGNGASASVQREAGAQECDLLIAATASDETNMLCCIVAKKLGSAHTIARIRNPEYFEHVVFLKEELGLSMTINPERAAAVEIFRILQYPSFLKRDSFAKGRAEIVELSVKEGSLLDGKLLSELHKFCKVKVLICAVERHDQVIIPDGTFRLQKQDKIYVTASRRDLAALIQSLKLGRRKISQVIIVGGGNIAYYLATDLLATGIGVKLIELSPARSKELAEMLPKAEIILGDGSSQQVLLSEGIQLTDAIITLTNMDEENLLISMYANYLGVPKVITKINRTEYYHVVRDKGIDSIISPRMLITHDIVRYVRSLQNAAVDSPVITLHRFVDDQVDALEFRVSEGCPYVGKTLIEIRLKPNILIACISRGTKVIIPSGHDTIEIGDTVVVVATAEQMIDELADIFAPPL